MARQCPPVAQSDRLAADHGARRGARSDSRRNAAAGNRRQGTAAGLARSRRRSDGPAVARGARSVRNAISAGPVAAIRRQYQPHRAIRRHGAQRAAPQIKATRRELGRTAGQRTTRRREACRGTRHGKIGREAGVMLTGRPRVLLYDWDNTLVDGWAGITAALNAAFTAFT